MIKLLFTISFSVVINSLQLFYIINGFCIAYTSSSLVNVGIVTMGDLTVSDDFEVLSDLESTEEGQIAQVSSSRMTLSVEFTLV